MTNLRSHLDPDQPGTVQGPTPFKTEGNEFQVNCGMCGAIVFVNEDMYRFAKEGIDAGLENPFKCDACEEEEDQLFY